MIVPYTTERGRFIPGTPHAWPVARYQTRGRARMFDLSPDGSHVVLALAADGAGGGIATAQFVLNFFEELRRRAPASTP